MPSTKILKMNLQRIHDVPRGYWLSMVQALFRLNEMGKKTILTSMKQALHNMERGLAEEKVASVSYQILGAFLVSSDAFLCSSLMCHSKHTINAESNRVNEKSIQMTKVLHRWSPIGFKWSVLAPNKISDSTLWDSPFQRFLNRNSAIV